MPRMMPSPMTPLGALERRLLDWLLERDWVDVRSAHAAHASEPPRSPKTVQSALERLIRKGLAERKRAGRAFLYRAVVSRRALLGRAFTNVIDQLPGSDPRSLLAAFVDVADRLDAKALEELERLVAERRSRPEPKPVPRAGKPR